MAQAEQANVPERAMQKVIPPRLVEPYLAGHRDVIAGFVYRAADCAGARPDQLFHMLDLGYPGSEFTPDAPEMFVMRWLARDTDTYQVPHGLEFGGDWRQPPPFRGNGFASGAGERIIPEMFTDPMPIPVGAEIYRVTASGEDFVARYDGRGWLRAVRQEG